MVDDEMDLVVESDSGPAPADPMALLVESLDVGVLLVDSQGTLLVANSLARELAASFGTITDRLPGMLFEHLKAPMDACRALHGRFTPAVPISSPDRRRMFVRCRVARGNTFAITIAAAALREIDVKRVLAEQFGLSAQEIRIAFLAAQGFRNREIAEHLQIVEGTVKNYLTNVFAALAVRSRTELASELAQLVEEQTDIHRRVP
jgi:DNA-binding CsgD family transcriptional regulator